jgi:hypothetical protein
MLLHADDEMMHHVTYDLKFEARSNKKERVGGWHISIVY